MMYDIEVKNGFGGADHVVLGRSGIVFDPNTGEPTGSLTQGGDKKESRCQSWTGAIFSSCFGLIIGILKCLSDAADLESCFTIKEALHKRGDAEEEVNRLHEINNEKECVHSCQKVRFYPDGRRRMKSSGDTAGN